MTRRYRPREPDSTGADSRGSEEQGQGRQTWNDDTGNQIASALHNADRSLTPPMPTTVVVDATGVILWIDVHPNYTPRSEVPDMLAAVDSAR